MKVVLTVLILLIASISSAQPIATPTQSLAWDYPDELITDFQVIRFEVRFDTGLPTDAGMVQVEDLESYMTPIPALTTGSHDFWVRACNQTQCGDWSQPFTFRLAVFPAPTSIRVINTP